MPGLHPMPSQSPRAQDASPLQWWTRSQLNAMSSHIAKAWAAWAHQWVGEAAPAAESADGVPAHEWSDREAAVWIALGARGEAAAWIDVRTDPVAALFELLFGADTSAARPPSAVEGIAQSVAFRAWMALAEALRTALGLDACPGHGDPHPTLFKPWAGAAMIPLPVSGRLPSAMLLNAACLRTMAVAHAERPTASGSVHKPDATLFPLAQALAGRMLALRAELWSCELDLGSLESLRIGDVVPLPHHLDAPLLVSVGSNAQLCVGFLGRQAGFKAIELARELPGDNQAQGDHAT